MFWFFSMVTKSQSRKHDDSCLVFSWTIMDMRHPPSLEFEVTVPICIFCSNFLVILRRQHTNGVHLFWHPWTHSFPELHPLRPQILLNLQKAVAYRSVVSEYTEELLHILVLLLYRVLVRVGPFFPQPKLQFKQRYAAITIRIHTPKLVLQIVTILKIDTCLSYHMSLTTRFSCGDVLVLGISTTYVGNWVLERYLA